MKIRNVVQGNKLVLFGSLGKDGSGKRITAPNYVEVDLNNPDINKIKEYKRIEIVNCLSVLKGELKHNTSFGVSLLEKATKEFLDIEIMSILRNDLSLMINKWESKKVDRNYELYFEVTTPEGVELNINYNYNFVS